LLQRPTNCRWKIRNKDQQFPYQFSIVISKSLSAKLSSGQDKKLSARSSRLLWRAACGTVPLCLEERTRNEYFRKVPGGTYEERILPEGSFSRANHGPTQARTTSFLLPLSSLKTVSRLSFLHTFDCVLCFQHHGLLVGKALACRRFTFLPHAACSLFAQCPSPAGRARIQG
jgi:hypothetical protein